MKVKVDLPITMFGGEQFYITFVAEVTRGVEHLEGLSQFVINRIDAPMFTVIKKDIMDNNTKSLTEEELKPALLAEIERVEEIIAWYKTIPTGSYAATLMRIDINRAKSAFMDENLSEMADVYEKLKAWEM